MRKPTKDEIEVVAESLAASWAEELDSLPERQQRRFKRDASKAIAALDEYRFFHDLPSSKEPTE